jgi:hypothetical protein
MGIGTFCSVNGGQCKQFVGCPEFGAGPEGEIIMPKLGESLAPWVVLTLEESGQKITVGNESCPGFTSDAKCGGGPVCGKWSTQRNTAIIKSMQVSMGGGGDSNASADTKIEVIDEEGGSFTSFVQNDLAKDRTPGEPQKAMKMSVQWGWTYERCELSERISTNTVLGGPRDADSMVSIKGNFTPHDVTVDTEKGYVKYCIHGILPVEQMVASESEEEVFGWDSGNRMRLKAAIREMFKKHNMDVLFLTLDPKSSCGGGPTGIGHVATPTYEWSFRKSDGGCQGPLRVWKTEQRDPVQAAIVWLQEHVTKNTPKKGFVIGYDHKTAGRPTIIFWESPKPDCQGNMPIAFGGTYVVNGGSCSPVISFKPKYQWLSVANKRQGGASGETSQEAIKPGKGTDDQITCNVTGDGSPDRSIGGHYNEEAKGRDAQRETNEAYSANQRAQAPAQRPLDAELVIQGDPKWSDPYYVFGRRIAIVHINPFHILKDAGKGQCADWLAKPSCNPVTSNKNWIVTGCDHQIKEGSYITTLRLTCVAPGDEIDAGLPIGGANSGSPITAP